MLRTLDVERRTGLAPGEAQARLARHGPNRLRPPERRGPLARFLLQFHNVLIYVLVAAGSVTALLGDLVDAAVIAGVVLINAVFGFVQEGKAEKALDAMRKMLSLRAVVLREGRRQEIAAEELVPGDIVLLGSGDKVPADLRLVEVRNLRVEEAALTGESAPVEKAVAAVAVEAPIGDRSCMAYSGTLVAFGQGRGVVVATGDATEIGRIGRLLEQVEEVSTPLLPGNSPKTLLALRSDPRVRGGADQRCFSRRYTEGRSPRTRGSRRAKLQRGGRNVAGSHAHRE